jgi:hypothetical protein
MLTTGEGTTDSSVADSPKVDNSAIKFLGAITKSVKLYTRTGVKIVRENEPTVPHFV